MSKIVPVADPLLHHGHDAQASEVKLAQQLPGPGGVFRGEGRLQLSGRGDLRRPGRAGR